MPEPKFVPKPGQVDYTNIRYAPVLDVVVTRNGKILLAKRSADRRMFPDCWAAVAGFLDDSSDIEAKAYEELGEELGIKQSNVTKLTQGQVILREDPVHNKTYLIVPLLAEVTTDKFTLDWEADEAKWFTPKEIPKLNLMPGMINVIGQFFPEVLE
ncbi:MAG TPA: NUDIX domain-containing protein [Candidatus Saccharimonadales bacterium]|nr:NUDIX domain-containing protein [Candidatus Saccharimonadales bacterium]